MSVNVHVEYLTSLVIELMFSGVRSMTSPLLPTRAERAKEHGQVPCFRILLSICVTYADHRTHACSHWQEGPPLPPNAAAPLPQLARFDPVGLLPQFTGTGRIASGRSLDWARLINPTSVSAFLPSLQLPRHGPSIAFR